VTDAPTEREGEGTWTRLRRRKLVQWGIAYAAGAWGLMQGVAYMRDTFGWTRQVQQATTLLLLIGLPIALVLAWYHGDKGERRVTRTELAMLTLLFLLGGGLFWRYQHATESPSTAAATTSSATAPAAISPADAGPSIAVLPFENRSAKQDDAFFVDGIHDDILTQLSKISALKVISRTSVEQFRDTKLPMKAIAEQLGVKSILEGGVQRAGDRVRINVQLINASTDAHLWAETYDRALTAENIFAIQTELAAAIAGALKAALTPAEKARVNAVPTRNLEAWEAYQLGKQRMAKRTSGGLIEAEKFFRKALELDPKFTLAYVGLADTLRLQTNYSGKPLETTLAEADQAVSKALELDANLAEAWASKGGIAMSRDQNEQAEKLLRRAIEVNPNYATAHHWLSMVLRSGDRLQEEFEHAERAAQLDPLSSVAQANFGNTLERMQRYDDAASRYQSAIDFDPRSTVSLLSLAELDAYARNQFVDAALLEERAVALDSDSPVLAVSLALLWLDLDDAPRARREIRAAARRWPDDLYAMSYSAAIAASLGESVDAERYAKRALADYPRDYYSLSILRNIDLQRGDPKTARSRYAAAYPELTGSTSPQVDAGNYVAAIDLAFVLQSLGEIDRSTALLDASELTVRSLPRLTTFGYGIADAQIHALRGDKARALAALREAEKAGWRGRAWRYYRDFDPALASIRNDPEFKAVFADIERDMARQRAELAARPKDAPLDLGEPRK